MCPVTLSAATSSTTNPAWATKPPVDSSEPGSRRGTAGVLNEQTLPIHPILIAASCVPCAMSLPVRSQTKHASSTRPASMRCALQDADGTRDGERAHVDRQLQGRDPSTELDVDRGG